MSQLGDHEFEYADFPVVGASSLRRPFLWVELRLPGNVPLSLLGLVDSGADVSTLPLEAAELFGYDLDDLQETELNVAGGAVPGYAAPSRIAAKIHGIDVSFELEPVFNDDEYAIWGRRDVFERFLITFDEAGQRFALTPRDDG